MILEPHVEEALRELMPDLKIVRVDTLRQELRESISECRRHLADGQNILAKISEANERMSLGVQYFPIGAPIAFVGWLLLNGIIAPLVRIMAWGLKRSIAKAERDLAGLDVTE